MRSEEKLYDTIIIGGGAAGLSAALVLARAHADVVIIDNQNQSNAVSAAVHGVFTHDGTPPEEMYSIARSQLENYPSMTFIQDMVIASQQRDKYFSVSLSSGGTLTAKTLLLAQGVQYELPNIPGIKELWGDKVWHCPFCHGYEATNKNVLAIGSREKLAHLKLLLPRWTSNVDYKEIAEIKKVTASKTGVTVHFADDSRRDYEGIFAQTTPKPRDTIAESLGCARNTAGLIEINEFGQTSVGGMYSAGDQSSMMQQVNIAVAAGHKTGMSIVMELQGIRL